MNLRLDSDRTGEGSPYCKAVSKLLRESCGNRDEEFDYCENEYHNILPQ